MLRRSTGGTVMTDASKPTFEIGIAMSGAISAGAYSAGVFDFLIQALDAWEKAKAEGTPDLPDYDVRLKALSGASAGAITAAIGVIAAGGREAPATFASPAPGSQDIRFTLGRLYRSWVTRPTLVSPDGSPDLLSLEDLAGGRAVVSVLNANLLTAIGVEALEAPGTLSPRPYVASSLHLYMMLSNLRGVPYAIHFNGGQYNMMTHADRVHYVVEGIGAWKPTPSPFADTDSGTSIEATSLFGTTDASARPPEWLAFANAALASGAFPIGLSPRVIETATLQYAKAKFPISEDQSELRPLPTWPEAWRVPSQDHLFSFVSVDGGLINNDPFEYVRFTLMKDPPRPNERKAEKADRAVIMIAPFPEAPPFLGDGEPSLGVLSIARHVVTALRQQVRFKPDQLLAVAAEGTHSRFMISPHRVPPRIPGGEEREETFSIASGLLGGFGGFVLEAFRDHDYQLGRRNCQYFLARHLTIDKNHETLHWPEGAAERLNAVIRKTLSDGSVRDYVPIIPLVGDALPEVPYPSWARIGEDAFALLITRIEARLVAVARRLIATEATSVRMKLGLNFLLLVGRNRIIDYIRLTLLQDLVLRDQIEGWSLPAAEMRPEVVRAVLAALLDPAFDLRTEAGIARTTKLDVSLVREILDLLTGAADARCQVWVAPWTRSDGPSLYTLVSRRPSFLATLLQGRSPARLFAKPVVDRK
ncbi:hypothetical protein E0H36_25805 [Rhizobium leguminosarum bv. viciae]|nr:hypothetical protein [Rhizobium leguminosarum]TBZ28681.1 hypothetical protein E0H36_25805 [Rhizobium leguminosarum bv. viciae]